MKPVPISVIVSPAVTTTWDGSGVIALSVGTGCGSGTVNANVASSTSATEGRRVRHSQNVIARPKVRCHESQLGRADEGDAQRIVVQRGFSFRNEARYRPV